MNELRRKILNDFHRTNHKEYVLYWMQQSQRIHFNHALNEAIKYANERNLPVVIYFGLIPNYPDGNERHYVFMLEGLKEVAQMANHFGMTFVLKIGNPTEVIKPLLKDAEALFMDMGYLKFQKEIRQDIINYVLSHEKDLYTEMIDTDLMVPVEVASQKVEYGAYTIRPKIYKLVENFRDFFHIHSVKNQTKINLEENYPLDDIDGLVKGLPIDHFVKQSPIYHGGYIEGMKLFHKFVSEKINQYSLSNNPSLDLTSKLSMYLHFGQISTLEIYERLYQLLMQGQILGDAFDGFIEQLIIRRELAHNYVYYQKGYDEFESMTEPWAYQTMKNHDEDIRSYLYTIEDYENFQTHDPYFNAAMKEMVYTGYMHNYMRMYWAKKIIEWSNTHKDAFETITYLNNKYFIDGRDANSYTGIAWCFGKHDRPWQERSIFGKLRYMNQAGLLRKFDMEDYVDRMNLFTKR